jgi:hypothetical protein
MRPSELVAYSPGGVTTLAAVGFGIFQQVATHASLQAGVDQISVNKGGQDQHCSL